MEPNQHITPTARDLAKSAEAFLFVEGGTLSKKTLASRLHIEPHALEGILDQLAHRLLDRGVTLLRTENEVSLAVSADVSQEIEAAYTDEKEIGDAGLEVLAIILYRGASTKARIDYIRGVNTSSTIRSLLSRGLIERANNPTDSREYLYRPTTALLAHLGITHSEELPEYGKIKSTLTSFEAQKESSNDTSHGTFE